tara:strand:+ start:8001 stop:8906 length:906 start_codon:yes stop_codon:yes gene_type:complete
VTNPGDTQPPGTHQWNTFLDTPPDEDRFDDAKFVVLPAPYETTTSFLTGTRDGPSAIVNASAQLEDYDLELDADISIVGIHTAPALVPNLHAPQAIVEQVDQVVDWVAAGGKIPALLGGEHTVTVGAVKAMSRRHTDLSVLYLDAHGDLRDSYMGTGWGHASVARRLLDVCPVVHAGVRSISAEERSYIDEQALPVHYWPPITGLDDYVKAVVDALAASVYVSIDLDVLDPSIMAAVGTPEPDGMDWRQLTLLLRRLGQRRRIVGFDVVELCPRAGPPTCAYTAAKLVYKVMGYSLAFDQT